MPAMQMEGYFTLILMIVYFNEPLCSMEVNASFTQIPQVDTLRSRINNAEF